MKKIIQNLSLLAACAATLIISGCANTDSGATAGQRASLNNTGAGVGGTGVGNTGAGGPGFGGSDIGSRGAGAGSVGGGGVYGGGR